MNAVFVSHTGLLGGAERCLLDLAEVSAARGDRLLVICPEEGPLTAALSARTIEWQVVTMRRPRRGPALMLETAAKWRSTVSEIERILRDRSASVVLNNTVDALYAPFAATAAGVPCVWHIHESRPDQGFLRGILARQIRRHATRAVFNSQATRAAFAGSNAPAGWQVVYNGVAWQASPAPDRPADGTVVVGFVGDMRPHKRPDLFLRSLALARNSAPELRGVMVGDGTLLDSMRQLAASLGLGNVVEFRGRVSDVASVYSGIDMLVSTSEREGFGLVLAEAMQAGRPVIASRVGGIPELIEDGVSGLLVPPGDATEFARRIVDLARDRGLRARLGTSARERIRTRFTVERYCGEMLGVLDAVARR